MSRTEDTERIRQAWLADKQPDPNADCPDPERLFEAASGNLTPEQVRPIVLHTTRCGACAQSWRVALELQRARGQVRQPLFGARPALFAWAAAAAIMLAVGVVWMLPMLDPGPPGPSPHSVMRGDDGPALGLRVPDRSRIPADRFRLQWEAVDSVREYRVLVSDAGLVQVFSGTTRETEIHLHESHFEKLSDGDELHWFVIARLKDGSELRSATRTVILDMAER